MDMIPQILPQLGPDNLENLKNFATQTLANNMKNQEDDDYDVPALVENINFEEVASEPVAKPTEPNADDNDVPELQDQDAPDQDIPEHEIIESDEKPVAV